MRKQRADQNDYGDTQSAAVAETNTLENLVDMKVPPAQEEEMKKNRYKHKEKDAALDAGCLALKTFNRKEIAL